MNNLLAHQEAQPARTLAPPIDVILADLARAIAARFRVLGVLTLPIWNRLARTRRRLANLLARAAAGRHRTTRPLAIRLPRPKSIPAPGIEQPPVIPRHRAWLGPQLDHNGRGFGSQLQTLLHAPGAAEALAAAPCIARTLRPLCHTFGVDLPALLRLPPRPPRRRPARARAPTVRPGATPDRPISAYVLAAARAWKRRSRKTD